MTRSVAGIGRCVAWYTNKENALNAESNRHDPRAAGQHTRA